MPKRIIRRSVIAGIGAVAMGTAITLLAWVFGALQQASVADATAQNQTVARCDGQAPGLCFSR